jgi:N-acetylmuramoyl-L-alanine amidase
MFSFLGGPYCFNSNASNKPVVVVIDPGHGGIGDKNQGAQYNGFSEKEITLQVANAMKAELEKYDDVVVYLTRSTDTNMTLEERAAFAKSVNADFVYSIHFNASANHEFYGSEVWTSAYGQFYKKGQEFGKIESDELGSLGLYQKGVKTRLGSKGDYYGIIRQSTVRNIPCVIIEHAYLDHMYDVQYLRTENVMQKFGVADATAVAKYFKLKSSSTGADYSTYNYSSVKAPSNAVPQDQSGPDYCNIQVVTFDAASRNALVSMSTKDSQSDVIYFAYSYDGGNTFSLLQMWDRTKETQSFNVFIPKGITDPQIVCRAYNCYERFTQSEAANVPNYSYQN